IAAQTGPLGPLERAGPAGRLPPGEAKSTTDTAVAMATAAKAGSDRPGVDTTRITATRDRPRIVPVRPANVPAVALPASAMALASAVAAVAVAVPAAGEALTGTSLGRLRRREAHHAGGVTAASATASDIGTFSRS